MELLPPSAFKVQITKQWTNSTTVYGFRRYSLHEQIEKLEDDLKSATSYMSLIAHPAHHNDMIVAVYATKKQRWVRGRIMSTGTSYEVALLDYYEPPLDDRCNVVHLPEWAKSIPPTVELVVLDSILPIAAVNIVDGVKVTDLIAYNFMRNNLGKEVYMDQHAKHQNLFVGELFFRVPNHPFVSARDALLENGLAILAPERFNDEFEHHFGAYLMNPQSVTEEGGMQLSHTQSSTMHNEVPVPNEENDGTLTYSVKISDKNDQERPEMLNPPTNVLDLSQRGQHANSSTSTLQDLTWYNAFAEQQIPELTREQHSLPSNVSVTSENVRHGRPSRGFNKTTPRFLSSGNMLASTVIPGDNQSIRKSNKSCQDLEHSTNLEILDLSVKQTSPVVNRTIEQDTRQIQENRASEMMPVSSSLLTLQSPPAEEHECVEVDEIQRNPVDVNLVESCFIDLSSDTSLRCEEIIPNIEKPSNESQAGRPRNCERVPANISYKISPHTQDIPVHKMKRNKDNQRSQHAAVVSRGLLEILIFGKPMAKPVDQFETVFDERVVQVLRENGWTTPSYVQKFAIPAVMHGSNVVLVHSKSMGQDEGLFAALASKWCNPQQWKNGSSPCSIGIYVCVGSEKSFEVKRNFAKYLAAASDPNGETPNIVYIGCGDRNLLQTLEAIQTRSFILVTTPNCITRLMCWKEWKFTSVKFIVLDDVDVLLKYYRVQIHQIINGCKFDQQQAPAAQIVALSKEWTKSMRLLSRLFITDPVFMISPGFEALAACRVHPTLLAISPGLDRLKLSCQIVAKEADTKKIVVACSGDEEAIEAYRGLQGIAKYKLLLATSQKTPQQLQETYKEWASRSTPILVQSDGALGASNIQDANLLINYSLPSTKKQFELRLHCLNKKLQHPLNSMKITNVEQRSYLAGIRFYESTSVNTRGGSISGDYEFDGTSHTRLYVNLQNQSSNPPELFIILADSDRQKLPVFQHLVENLQGAAPQWLQEITVEQTKAREDRKMMRDVCPSLCMVGFCTNQATCDYRHFLKGDHKELLNNRSVIDVEVVRVNAPTHFTVRVVDPVCQEESVAHEALKIAMNKYYRVSPTREILKQEELQAGLWCAVMDEAQNYVRVRLYCKADCTYHQSQWYVTTVDHGRIMKVNSEFLLRLPEQFLNLGPRAIDMYVANMQPPDFEPTWNSEISRTVREWFDVEPGKMCLCRIKIVAIIENILWATGISVTRYDGCCQELWSLQVRLVKELSVNENPLTMTKIMEMSYLDQEEQESSVDSDMPSDEEPLLRISPVASISSEINQELAVMNEEEDPTQVLVPIQATGKACQESPSVASVPDYLTNPTSNPDPIVDHDDVNMTEMENFCDAEPDLVNMLVEQLQACALVKGNKIRHQKKETLKRGFVKASTVESQMSNELVPVVSHCQEIPLAEEKMVDTTSAAVMAIDAHKNSEESKITFAKSFDTEKGDESVAHAKKPKTDEVDAGMECINDNTLQMRPRMCCSTLTPNMEWYQEGCVIVVIVLLKDLESYDVKLEHQHLKITCNHGGHSYKYDRKLFARVKPNLSSRMLRGSHLELMLYLEDKNIKWQQLAFELDEPCVRYSEKGDFCIDDFLPDWISINETHSN